MHTLTRTQTHSYITPYITHSIPCTAHTLIVFVHYLPTVTVNYLSYTQLTHTRMLQLHTYVKEPTCTPKCSITFTHHLRPFLPWYYLSGRLSASPLRPSRLMCANSEWMASHSNHHPRVSPICHPTQCPRLSVTSCIPTHKPADHAKKNLKLSCDNPCRVFPHQFLNQIVSSIKTDILSKTSFISCRRKGLKF